MATIKSYTDIPQSKKLTEILPLESADMHYFVADTLEKQEINYAIRCGTPIVKTDIPCWSLAALTEVMPESIVDDKNELIAYMSIYKYDSLWVYAYDYENQEDGNYISFSKESLVDACYEMILKLHELNLL